MKTTVATEPHDFLLVSGGPLFQLYRRMRLSGDSLELLRRRVLVITLFVWLPLLLLSVFDRHALGGGLKVPFLYDVEEHVRFLIALPVLIAAEVIVNQRIAHSIRQFVERRIVAGEDVPKFNAAVESALRGRNSVAVEGTLLLFVYTLGIWIWRSEVAIEEPSWYAVPDAGRLHLSLAGYWYAFVSIPIFQFILLRWYLRLVLWFRLLWQISRLNLHLSAAHPDRAGGIGFLGESAYAFGPILFAQGAILAGIIANRVLHEGKDLLSFKMEAAGFVCLFVMAIFVPLLMFTPLLSRAKRKAYAEYGLLANRYLFGFEDKWIEGAPETSELLGAADFQSLADLGNSYAMVREMHIVPFGFENVTRLAIATATPFLPLVLTIFSIRQVAEVFIKIAFR
jgi:hypothetical protein